MSASRPPTGTRRSPCAQKRRHFDSVSRQPPTQTRPAPSQSGETIRPSWHGWRRCEQALRYVSGTPRPAAPTPRTDAGATYSGWAHNAETVIFRRRAALDRLGERLFDANRTIGQPTKLTMIFGRKVTKRYRGQLQTVIEDLDLPNPVIRTHYRHGFAKQYVRDHVALRTEPATNNVNDYGVKKAVEHLPELREKMGAVIDNYLNVQQDILETFVDRGQLRTLAAPTVLPSGKRIPGLKLDHPRQLALMHALVRFAPIPAQH